ncbi:MAG: hypothetical protein WAV20_01710 [Blastocatellia bacterium]
MNILLTPMGLMKKKLGSWILLWILFFLICLGLGYPTLNRYDPRTAGGTIDSVDYYKLVTVGPEGAEDIGKGRILVPYVAKPFYWAARGRVRTWDPALFGLLIANALFTAITACLLVSVGYQTGLDLAIALLGSMLYLLNFAIPNFHLAGMVDSGEACALMALTWTLFARKWWVLPVLGVFGALAKETFVPLATVFGLVWSTVEGRRRGFRSSPLVWTIALGATSLLTVMVLHSMVYGHIVWPWNIAFQVDRASDFLTGLIHCISDRSFWYMFVWLLPLGVWRLRHLPKPWVLASTAAAITALAMGAYRDSFGNVARPVFNAAGPILSLSVAILVAEVARAATASARGNVSD